MLRLSTCSNRSFSDETVKNFSRVSRRFGQSSNICSTVSGSLQDSQTGWSSPDIRYEWVRRQWPSQSLLIITASRRERILVCWVVPKITSQAVRPLTAQDLERDWQLALEHVRRMRSAADQRYKTRTSVIKSVYKVTSAFSGGNTQEFSSKFAIRRHVAAW